MSKLSKRLFLSFTIGICIMLFVLLAVLTTINNELKIDTLISNWLIKISSNGAIEFFKIFTYVGSIYTLIIIALACLFLKKKAYGITAIITLVFASLFNVLVKYIIRRDRPTNMAVEEIGFSFPSAHAMLTLVMLGFVIFIVIKLIKKKWLKIILSVLLSVIILFVGLSRVILGVHYFTDVLAGWIIAIPILIVAIVFCNYLLKNPVKTNKRLM